MFLVSGAFDSREPVTSMLPGQFGNLVRVLVPDAAATPMDFHDIILEDLVGTPDSRASSLCLAKLPPSGAVGPQLCSNICINVRRTWSSYAVHVGKKKSMLASSAVEGPVLAHTVEYMSFVIWDWELGQLWRCPVEWCTVWKGS